MDLPTPDDIEKLLEQGQEDAAKKDRLRGAGRSAPRAPRPAHDMPELMTAWKRRSEKDSANDVGRPRSQKAKDVEGNGVDDGNYGGSADGSDRSSEARSSQIEEKARRDERRNSQEHYGRRRSRSPRPARDDDRYSSRHDDRRDTRRDDRRDDRDGRDSRDGRDGRDDDPRRHFDRYREDGYSRSRGDDRRDKYRDRSPGDRRGPRGYGREDRDRRDGYASGRGRHNDHRGHSPGRGRRARTPEPTDDERDRRTVFVQQLANRLATRQLEEFFSAVGPVVEAQIVKDRISKRSKGVGYVEFKDEESVKKAIDLTGQKLLGIPVIVQLTEAEKNRQARENAGPTISNGIPFHRLYVGNIHFNITEEDLEGIFSQYGEVEFIQLQKDENGRSRGYGFVQFAVADDAKQALAELNGFELAGRPIRVGLGNEKLAQESNQAMMQRLNQNNKDSQGSAFSGAGGRGPSGNNQNDANASALDDSELGGVNYKNFSRESLMKKLARNEDILPIKDKDSKSTNANPSTAPTPSHKVSRCIVVKNVYAESGGSDPNWEKDLEEDFRDECSDKYGEVVHCGVPRDRNEGALYIKFKELKGGDNALKGLNGRLFDGRLLTAAPIVDAIYNTNFPKAADL